ncbi:hypothetical protein BC828DRAFT_377249 [Blastocladiella britannica]|nr:hypothetical protein BC828DRAFT_377249 [Blastocladiella britannica]
MARLYMDASCVKSSAVHLRTSGNPQAGPQLSSSSTSMSSLSSLTSSSTNMSSAGPSLLSLFLVVMVLRVVKSAVVAGVSVQLIPPPLLLLLVLVASGIDPLPSGPRHCCWSSTAPVSPTRAMPPLRSLLPPGISRPTPAETPLSAGRDCCCCC